jgi:hypothetical protein
VTTAADQIWRSPLARFAVHSISSRAHERVDGAVGHEGVVWQPGSPDGMPERRASRHPDSLAAVLAEVIGLGPRPLPFAPDVGDRLTWPEVVDVARAGTLHIVLWRPAGDQAERTAVAVIDADGYALVVPAEEPSRYRLEPTSPSLVWAELCRLLVRLVRERPDASALNDLLGR